jgi:repressor of nif and glnA expression
MSPGQAALEHGTGTLADLLADARAIPKAAYGASRASSSRASRAGLRGIIDLTEPAIRIAIAIPEAAAMAFADYLR